jgi:hypothetical protein
MTGSMYIDVEIAKKLYLQKIVGNLSHLPRNASRKFEQIAWLSWLNFQLEFDHLSKNLCNYRQKIQVHLD